MPDSPAVLTLRFGNPNPQMQKELPDGTRISVPAEHLNQSVTTVSLWDGITDPETVAHTLSTDNDRVLSLIARSLPKADRRYAVVIHELEQVLGVHSAGDAPRWIACEDDPDLERVVAAHYNCAQGEPLNLITNGGRDAVHAQVLGTSAQPASFNYMALTASTTTPVATNTTLPGEIATTGLARAQATYAHTTGTNTSTLTKTFTAVSADVAGGAVVLAQFGIFNASSSGTLGIHTALNATATLAAAGDSVTVTETATIG